MIIKLHPQLINKIAAGEVVERPASVVKELIENSIDAKATKINIELKNAGIDEIKVTDNGVGMNKEDAVLSVDSHTTSKIVGLEDLENIFTMGFRGEALASISSVSKFSLVTKDKNSKSASQINIDSKGKKIITETSAPGGTSVTISHLFYNVPARKKFLKSAATEFKNILSLFQSYAIAYPNISFVLVHNSKQIYNLPKITKDSSLDETLYRLKDIYGGTITDNLIPLNTNISNIKISGFLGHPKLARQYRNNELIFLNKRPISDKIISRAIYDSYESQIPRGKYPVFFIFLECDPKLVDVNIHPRKLEVRFENPQVIYRAIYNACRQKLLSYFQKETKKTFEEARTEQRFPEKITPFSQGLSPRRIDVKKSLLFTKNLLGDKEIRQTVQPELINKEFSPRDFYKTIQVFDEVIILEKGNSLLFIDQHAAAERVTFENLKLQIAKNKVEKQGLLVPEILELAKDEFEMLLKNRDLLKKLGIILEVFGEKTFKVKEIPALLKGSNISVLINDIIGELSEFEEKGSSNSAEEKINDLIATMSCHTTVRAGRKMLKEEIDDLIRRLLACKSPYSCPHGRPIIWEISKDELEKKFGRP